jgi:hypothetical protein
MEEATWYQALGNKLENLTLDIGNMFGPTFGFNNWTN